MLEDEKCGKKKTTGKVKVWVAEKFPLLNEVLASVSLTVKTDQGQGSHEAAAQ